MDYYKVLNVRRGATKPEIKRAYYKLAMKYHPDRNPSESAHEQFIIISEAYDALMNDKTKRRVIPKRKKAPQKPPEKTKTHKDPSYQKASPEERRRRYKAAQERIKREGLAYYEQYLASYRMKLSIFMTLLSLILAIALTVDAVSGETEVQHTIQRFKIEVDDSNHSTGNYILTFEAGRDITVPIVPRMREDINVQLVQSSFLGTRYTLQYEHLPDRIYDITNAIENFRWLFVFILLIPLLRFWLISPHVGFYFFDFVLRMAYPILGGFILFLVFF